MEIIVLLKPDIVINNEIYQIKSEITKKLWTIEISKMIQLDENFLKLFYAQYVKEDFFQTNIVKNMITAPVIAMIVKTHSNITDFNTITDIKKEIRKKFAKDKSNNSLHVSDSFESASYERELLNW